MRIAEVKDAARDTRRAIVIAGPTGSGKSALALALAEAHGGIIINADALQVYAEWRILTARPSPVETARVEHALYGHVSRHESYSVGRWLEECAPLLAGARPIIVGGTGLYLTALTEGLAKIPAVPAEIRLEADALSLERLTAGLDAATRARIDIRNRARVQRAWEVVQATGRGLAAWQDDPTEALLPRGDALRLVLSAPPDVLTPRLAARFDRMLAEGALDEVAANLDDYDPGRPGDRAIGASELAAYLRGEIDLETARDRAIVATRRYAKRQRTWFRGRMRDWAWITPETVAPF
ncbi:tRNA dimethylallyltransferase [Palleronia aestuarii]|uniref:tRNA dimethylallyltransferase n=2 Tax=Palleronia aestuarii TaxID=568105 RepID=A0A2W7NJ51_9RHOB|nr:tRNA (adenosine(37)-N6)-dimethylallyltransferase MiaA [Palleronia aestuarii]PZX19900.1 tRNA dimethylallyltransferase [Palleronia aestuarii]